MMIFLHIPKTAGTTFQFILANSFGMRHCHLGYTGLDVIGQKDLDFAIRVFPKLRSASGENLIAPLNLSAPDSFYITFLREPISRVFSHYQDRVVRNHTELTFEQMLRSDAMLQDISVRMIAGEKNLDKAKRCLEQFHFVGLTEKFDLSLHILKRLSPHRLNLNYKRKLTAPDNTIKKSLQSDSRMVDMAREYNRLDLELYDFAQKDIFPRLCEKTGYRPNDQVTSFDNYSTTVKPGFLMHRIYNKGFFRQLCKRVYKEVSEPVAEAAATT